MNLPPAVQDEVDSFLGLASKRSLTCTSKSYYEEAKKDDTLKTYLERVWASDKPPSKQDEIFAKWLEGEPAYGIGFYKLVFAKGLRSKHGYKDTKFPSDSHRHEQWRSDPYIHSPDGRLLLFSHPSKGDVVLGMTTSEGKKLVAGYVKVPRMSRYTKQLLSASKALQGIVSPSSIVSPWDPRLGSHGVPLPSLVGMAMEPLS